MNEKLYFEDVDIGDEIGPVTRSVSDEDVIQFVSIRDEKLPRQDLHQKSSQIVKAWTKQ